MTDVATPQPISDAVEEQAAKLFGSLEGDLALKCRFQYAHAKVEARQERGKDVPQSLLERHGEIEGKLRERGYSPSSLIK